MIRVLLIFAQGEYGLPHRTSEATVILADGGAELVEVDRNLVEGFVGLVFEHEVTALVGFA